MKRILLSALSAGFLGVLVIGCSPTATSEKTTATGATHQETSGRGMAGGATTEKELESTKK